MSSDSESYLKNLMSHFQYTSVQNSFFIYSEGENRHPKQDIKLGPKGKNGKAAYVDYIVKLPKRSLEEFCRWVYRFMGNAQFISPQYLAEQHQKFARALIDRYSSKAI
ncbi:hypothetical protein [Nostoc sp.]|uniref:hypothetical protein n=1 Tax=Nostoc sp. TaxID=1180 RepID=UPI002FF4A8F0